MVLLSSAAPAFKDAFYRVAKTMFANDPRVLVSFGQPSIERNEDMIFFLDVSSSQEIANMTTNRSREETLTLQVYVYSHYAGEADNDLKPSDRMYALLGQLENYVRASPGNGGDTTLGGVVRQCFLTEHTSSGYTANANLGGGRVVDCLATFTALARITN